MILSLLTHYKNKKKKLNLKMIKKCVIKILVED